MPVSLATARDPFRVGTARAPSLPIFPILRIPQARVLRALVPDDPAAHPVDWPTLTRARLMARAGFTPLSGAINQALHGVTRVTKDRPKLLPGLLPLGFVEVVSLDLDGLVEDNYRITPAGLAAYQQYVAVKGELPPVKSAAQCTNHRYREVTDDASIDLQSPDTAPQVARG